MLQDDFSSFQDTSKKGEYLQHCRQLPGYAEYSFLPCPSDARKSGQSLVIPVISFSKFKLRACLADGTPESQEIEFEWNDILGWSVAIPPHEDDPPVFSFEYVRAHRPTRTVRIFSQFAVFLKECFDKVRDERAEEN